MHKRDWAGTVLVACLTIAAALLHDHTILLVLLGAVAFACVLVIVWDVSHERGRKASTRRSTMPEQPGETGVSASDSAFPLAIYAKEALRASARVGGRRSAEQREQSAESDSRVALAERLARLHGEGRKLRQEVKPDLSDPWQALTHMASIFRYPTVPISAEQNIRRWAERVQNQLALSARRFVPEWERDPLPHPPLLQVNLVADGHALVRFLDARLGLLENIIRELREGR